MARRKVTKLKRIKGKKVKSLFLLSPGGIYLVCPNVDYKGWVNADVCRIKHFHPDDHVLDLGVASRFATMYCKHCEAWKNHVAEDRQIPVKKNERTTFLAPLKKNRRVCRASSPAFTKKLKRVRGARKEVNK